MIEKYKKKVEELEKAVSEQFFFFWGVKAKQLGVPDVW